MAEGNGKSDSMMVPPSGTSVFKVGGQELRVSALTLWDLDLHGDIIRSMTPDDTVWSYGKKVLQIVAAKTDQSVDTLMKNCSLAEARSFVTSFNDLLSVSGFDLGEAAAATEVSGTGIQTPSPPDSPSEESAEATQLSLNNV